MASGNSRCSHNLPMGFPHPSPASRKPHFMAGPSSPHPRLRTADPDGLAMAGLARLDDRRRPGHPRRTSVSPVPCVGHYGRRPAGRNHRAHCRPHPGRTLEHLFDLALDAHHRRPQQEAKRRHPVLSCLPARRRHALFPPALALRLAYRLPPSRNHLAGQMPGMLGIGNAPPPPGGRRPCRRMRNV